MNVCAMALAGPPQTWRGSPTRPCAPPRRSDIAPLPGKRHPLAGCLCSTLSDSAHKLAARCHHLHPCCVRAHITGAVGGLQELQLLHAVGALGAHLMPLRGRVLAAPVQAGPSGLLAGEVLCTHRGCWQQERRTARQAAPQTAEGRGRRRGAATGCQLSWPLLLLCAAAVAGLTVLVSLLEQCCFSRVTPYTYPGVAERRPPSASAARSSRTQGMKHGGDGRRARGGRSPPLCTDAGSRRRGRKIITHTNFRTSSGPGACKYVVIRCKRWTRRTSWSSSRLVATHKVRYQS